MEIQMKALKVILLKYLGWDSGMAHTYQCYISPDGKLRFKGPILQSTGTHLQKSLGDDNVLVVKFAEEGNVRNLRTTAQEADALYRKFGEIIRDPSKLEFEAKSSKDGAWYDVETFLAHRFLSTGEAEVHVRFVGFGAEEDEWVNIKNSVRQRSIPLENTECSNLKVGDPVLCFQERRDQAIYYDARIVEIQRRMHDIFGANVTRLWEMVNSSIFSHLVERNDVLFLNLSIYLTLDLYGLHQNCFC